MRAAAVDIGTNSVRLLISEKKDKKLIRLEERLKVPRLGEGVNETGYLKQEAIGRTVQVLKGYKKLIDDFRATPYVVATSAVREAENKLEFIDRVKKELDLEVEAIPGKKEAYLSYLGIISELERLSGKILAIDIGGGSTELIVGDQEEIIEYESIEVGAVKLKEKFNNNLDQVKKQVEGKIKIYNNNCNQLVGVGGTITTLAAIEKSLSSYDRNEVHGSTLSKDRVKKMLNELKELPLSERKRVKGLSPDRADIILQGIIILLEVMNKTGLKKVIVSDSGILEGIIYDNI